MLAYSWLEVAHEVPQGDSDGKERLWNKFSYLAIVAWKIHNNLVVLAAVPAGCASSDRLEAQ